ncbi:NAD(P)H-dependent oxidoreductase [Flavobacterium paronense]|uniref:NAD(P)H-dependent oxidoreductase n=1 Tax=Flavobacterium paronense TaxID=1392775 RepID=A0ABV5GA46_9FLAO|nr:NAD(P)H-dependent oxidoreductase [Flavobacterium paronense]MDN3677340.1 NAD(P)H-dependent oxidoreductase [Flavobacterium paronense]
MSNFIKNANWRYATKKFDATKKVSNEDLETLKEAIRLSASSYGLQPYKVLIVDNPEIRAQLQPAAWGQAQIVDASHLIVFANITNIGENEINAYFKDLTETRGIPMEAVQGYSDFMKSKVTALPLEVRNSWTSKQTYLALGNLLNAAAELHIDVTPMEGFEAEKVNEILGLDKLGLSASLIAPIGYRHAEDDTQHYAKVRKSNEELFINL